MLGFIFVLSIPQLTLSQFPYNSLQWAPYHLEYVPPKALLPWVQVNPPVNRQSCQQCERSAQNQHPSKPSSPYGHPSKPALPYGHPSDPRLRFGFPIFTTASPLPCCTDTVTTDPSGSGTDSSLLARRSLGSYPLAVCNDGTTAVYYSQENTPAAKKMVVFLQGGGACFDKETCETRCSGGEDAELCTAPTDGDYSNSDTMWSNDPNVNPPFHDFFKVNVPYCSSDAYSGTRAASADTGNYAFHGKFIVRAIIEDLIASNSWLTEATQIVLIGSSAGSYGVAKNCDEIAERFRQVNTNVEVRCIMDGGDFYPYTHYTTCDPLEEAKKPISFWQAENDKSCGDAAECNIFGASFEHVNTPFMVLASQQDRTAAQPFCTPDPETPGSEEFWNKWKTEMVALANRMIQSRPESGLHISGCPYHVAVSQPWIWSDLKVTAIDGEGSLALKDLIHNWLTGAKPSQAMDPAGVGQGCQK